MEIQQGLRRSCVTSHEKRKKNRDRTRCTQKSLMDADVRVWVQGVQLFRGVPSYNISIGAPNGLR